MAKREKKPKVVKFHLYGNDLEAELRCIREETKIKEEMHRNWDNPEYWKLAAALEIACRISKQILKDKGII
jgi:hypothetical protein